MNRLLIAAMLMGVAAARAEDVEIASNNNIRIFLVASPATPTARYFSPAASRPERGTVCSSARRKSESSEDHR